MKLTTLNNYPGHKGIEGLYQFIINRIPPHTNYFEIFAGSAQIARKLPHGSIKVVVDCNSGVTAILKKEIGSMCKVVTKDALQFIPSIPAGTDTMVYMDPPYIISSRHSKRKIYQSEMTLEDHKRFLSMVHKAKFNCMISHYEHPFYDKMLKGWNKEKKTVRYHTRTTEECIYYNYPKPTALQTYDYIGNDCWDRQRIDRKIKRLTKKLIALPCLERNAVIDRVHKNVTVVAKDNNNCKIIQTKNKH